MITARDEYETYVAKNIVGRGMSSIPPIPPLAAGDFALFFRRAADKLMALFGSYVDDILQAGTRNVKEGRTKAEDI